MKSASVRFVAILVVCAAAGFLTACDEVKDAVKKAAGDDGVWCLDELLDMAGLTRDDLGKNADKVVADALSAQKEMLGESYVIDCQAQDKNAGLTKPGGSPGAGVPTAEQGENLVAPSAEDVPAQIGKIQDGKGGEGEDVVILMDATGSMRDDQAAVSGKLKTIMADVAAAKGRLAMAWYKDNQGCDDPWYQANASGLVDATTGFAEVQAFIDAVPVGGGCDWPESLYDAVYEAATTLAWESTTKRMIIVINDAPALDGDLTNHTKAQVIAKTAELGITVHTITVGISY